MAVAIAVAGSAGLLTAQPGLARDAQAQPAGPPWNAYVANSVSGTVSVLDSQTEAATASIPGAYGGQGVAISPDGATAYVVNDATGTVLVINTATRAVTATIPVGANPFGVTVSPNGATAYVTNGGSGTVSVINTATRVITATIPVGADPFGVAVSPDGATAYVTNIDSGTVSVISTATNAVTATIPVGANPYGVAVTPSGATVYVSNTGSGTVSVIDTATRAASDSVTVGSGPWGVAVTPDQAPRARVTVTPAMAGQATRFNAAASTVKYGTIASYQWNFGDGKTQTTTAATVSHTYSDSGHYTVTLTETSSGGTATTRVFTGQTVSRNGGPAARTTATFAIAGLCGCQAR